MELVSSELANRSPGKVLREVVSQVEDSRFLIVNANSIAPSRVSDAVKSYLRAGGKPRLCFAGGRRALSEIDALGLDNDCVGLMLDSADADTPWSDFAWDRIEAVRFRRDFVEDAGRSARTACVLESMLALAREIGMRTLGFGTPQGASVWGHHEFDYSPEASALRHLPKVSKATHRKAVSRLEAIVGR